MYADRSITHNPQTQALIDATPTVAKRKAERVAARPIIDAEIQWILRTEAQLMEPFNSNLSDERRERVARAMAHADVNDDSQLDYVRYAWMPFQRMERKQRNFARNGNARRRIRFPMQSSRRKRHSLRTKNFQRTALCF